MATITPTTTGSTSTTTGTTHGTTSTPLPSVTPTQTSTPTQSPTDTPTLTPTDTPTDTTTPSSGGSTSNTFTYSSSNASVATVSSGGKITAKGNGTAYITVKYPGLSDKQVTVNVLTYVTSVSITGSKTVSTGSKIALSKSFSPSNASDKFKTGNWTSSDTNVATVDNNGNVTGKSAGTATIKYKTTTGTAYEGSYTITVNTSSTSLSVTYGTSKLETVSLTYRDGIGTYQLNVETTPKNLSYTFESNKTSVATVSASGVVTIKGAGTALVYAKFAGNSTYSACEDYVTFKVNKGTQSLSISGNSSVNAGGTLQLTASGAKGTTSWKSSVESYATVSQVGLVTGKSAGKTTITLTSAATSLFNEKSVTKEITVNRNAQIFTINKSSLSLSYGGTDTLTYSGAKTGVTWSSSNTSIATVGSTTGKVTAKGVGTAKITATAAQTGTYSSYTKSCEVSVGKVSTSITLKDKNGNAAENLTFTYNPAGQVYQLTYFISDGVNPLNWTTSNASVVSLDNGYYGKLTIGSAGTATVKAYFDGNNYYNASNDTITITVNKASQTPSISGSSSVNAGSTITLTGSGQGTKTWSSDNTSVATVNSSTGVVTGVAAGTAKITLSCAGNTNYNAGSNYKTITVNSNAQTFTINKSSLSLSYGGTDTLTYSGAKTAVTWKSSNTSIATVGSTTGKVTAKGIGTASITATAAASGTYSSYTKSCSVTVGKANTSIKLKNAAGSEVDTITLTYNPTTTYYQLTYYISDAITNPQWSSTTPSVAYFDTTYYGLLYLGNAGSTTLKAYWDGNTYYNSASDTITFNVNKASNTVTLNSGSNISKTYGAAAFTVSRSATSGTPSITSSNTSVATVSGNTVTIKGVGTTQLTGSVAASTNYNAGSSYITLTVGKASQTITWKATQTPINIDSTSTFTVNGCATGSMYYSSNNTSVATVNATTGVVTGKAEGNARITAYAVGNTNYNASASIYKDIVISKLSQSLSKTSTVTSVNVGNTIQLSVSGCKTSLSWRSADSTIATVNNGVVTGVAGGKVKIYAKALSNAKYNASSEVEFEINVNKLSQTVTAKASNSTIYYNSTPKTSTISVTAGYGTPTYKITSGTGYAKISGNVVTATAAGTVTVTVTCAGNDQYNAGSTTVTIYAKYYSTGGSPGNVPSNTDPVSPGGSSEPSGSSTPSASPTETPTPSSSPGEGGQWIEIDGQRYYSSDDGATHSTNASGGPESVRITCSSDVTYKKEKSTVGDFYYVGVYSKNSNQLIFTIKLGDTYMTSSAPTSPNQNSGGSTAGPTSTSSPS